MLAHRKFQFCFVGLFGIFFNIFDLRFVESEEDEPTDRESWLYQKFTGKVFTLTTFSLGNSRSMRTKVLANMASVSSDLSIVFLNSRDIQFYKILFSVLNHGNSLLKWLLISRLTCLFSFCGNNEALPMISFHKCLRCCVRVYTILNFYLSFSMLLDN